MVNFDVEDTGQGFRPTASATSSEPCVASARCTIVATEQDSASPSATSSPREWVALDGGVDRGTGIGVHASTAPRARRAVMAIGGIRRAGEAVRMTPDRVRTRRRSPCRVLIVDDHETRNTGVWSSSTSALPSPSADGRRGARARAGRIARRLCCWISNCRRSTAASWRRPAMRDSALIAVSALGGGIATAPSRPVWTRLRRARSTAGSSVSFERARRVDRADSSVGL